MQKATFGTRAMAWFGDLLVLAVLASIISFIFGSAVGLTAGRESAFLGFLSAALLLIWGLLIFLLQFLYFGYFWSKDGQSIGMRWLNIRVVRQSKEGEISFWRAALRGSLGYWISAVIFYLGYLWALWDNESETWHDKIFDTWVVLAEQ
jgi:uncharacterized RDD family membrane protein YckC